MVGRCGGQPRHGALDDSADCALHRGAATGGAGGPRHFQRISGRRLSDISYAVQSFVEMHGFSVVRDFVGHGIGRALHEDPEIPNYGRPSEGPQLKEGMVFAIEPMVNMGSFHTKTLSDGWSVVTADGKPSAHFEHTIVITAHGPEILTK